MSTGKSKNSDAFLLRLISLMKKSGISKAQLARDLGVSNAHVANWLGGQMPRAEHLLPISRHFNVSMEWLLCGEEAQPSGKGGPGNAPLYNRGLGARELVGKIQQLKKDAAHFRQLAERHQGEAAEFIAKAEAYEDWAESLIETEEEDDDFEQKH